MTAVLSAKRKHSCRTRMLSLCLVVALLFLTAFSVRGAEGEKKIALTFDDGPHPSMTDEILSVLAEYDVKATFFVVGENAALYPEPLQRAVREGHEIGNHTYTHPKLKGQNAESFAEELSRTSRIIQEVTGVVPTLFRPPEGFRKGVITTVAEEQGFQMVLWTVDTLDWTDAPARDIEKRILSQVKDGSIILCHDYIVGKGHTAEALKRVIPTLLADGYAFVTVGELLS